VSASQTSIRWTEDPTEIAGALGVREEVFCREQGVPLSDEHDGRDGEALHLVALAEDGQAVVGTLRLLFEMDTAKVGRVAVERSWRRQGIALAMLEMALERARERGCQRARLAAQLDAIELYRRAGFEVESETFQEAGIDHVWMGRALEAGTQARSATG